MKRCGKRYGWRNKRVCARLRGHKRRHAVRPTTDELRRLYAAKEKSA